MSVLGEPEWGHWPMLCHGKLARLRPITQLASVYLERDVLVRSERGAHTAFGFVTVARNHAVCS
ncbi:hypothetical protein BN844_1605 [Pseudomonas sp. SHC52]|nr:hypothetical protein BN844_1605 [Pseudomonas sp. SHC52]